MSEIKYQSRVQGDVSFSYSNDLCTVEVTRKGNGQTCIEVKGYMEIEPNTSVLKMTDDLNALLADTTRAILAVEDDVVNHSLEDWPTPTDPTDERPGDDPDE